MDVGAQTLAEAFAEQLICILGPKDFDRKLGKPRTLLLPFASYTYGRTDLSIYMRRIHHVMLIGRRLDSRSLTPDFTLKALHRFGDGDTEVLSCWAEPNPVKSCLRLLGRLPVTDEGRIFVQDIDIKRLIGVDAHIRPVGPHLPGRLQHYASNDKTLTLEI